MKPEVPMPPLIGLWTTVAGMRVYSRVADPLEARSVPIVHIHGFAISGRYLEPTAVRLASHYPTYVPDLPGYGYSDKPQRPLNISELAEALAGYLDAVGLSQVVVLGNSSGCLVAAEFACRYPERTASAILVSPAGGRHNRPWVRGLAQLAHDALHEPPSLARIAIPDYVRFGVLNAARAFHRMTRYPTVERLSQIPVPFLTIVGTQDPLVSNAQMKRILRSTDAMNLVYLTNAAHAINFSHSESLARIVDSYLRGQLVKELAQDNEFIDYTKSG